MVIPIQNVEPNAIVPISLFREFPTASRINVRIDDSLENPSNGNGVGGKSEYDCIFFADCGGACTLSQDRISGNGIFVPLDQTHPTSFDQISLWREAGDKPENFMVLRGVMTNMCDTCLSRNRIPCPLYDYYMDFVGKLM